MPVDLSTLSDAQLEALSGGSAPSATDLSTLSDAQLLAMSGATARPSAPNPNLAPDVPEIFQHDYDKYPPATRALLLKSDEKSAQLDKLGGINQLDPSLLGLDNWKIGDRYTTQESVPKFVRGQATTPGGYGPPKAALPPGTPQFDVDSAKFGAPLSRPVVNGITVATFPSGAQFFYGAHGERLPQGDPRVAGIVRSDIGGTYETGNPELDRQRNAALVDRTYNNVQAVIGKVGDVTGNTLANSHIPENTPLGRVAYATNPKMFKDVQKVFGKDAGGVIAGLPSFALGTARASGADIGAALTNDPALRAQAQQEADQFGKDFVGSIIGAPHLDPNDPHVKDGWAYNAYKSISYLHGGNVQEAKESAKNVAIALGKGAAEHPVMTGLGIVGLGVGIAGARSAIETLRGAKEAARAAGDIKAAEGAQTAEERIQRYVDAMDTNGPVMAASETGKPTTQALPAESTVPVEPAVTPALTESGKVRAYATKAPAEPVEPGQQQILPPVENRPLAEPAQTLKALPAVSPETQPATLPLAPEDIAKIAEIQKSLPPVVPETGPSVIAQPSSSTPDISHVVDAPTLSDALQTHFKYTPEQADATAKIADARAQAWSNATGRPSTEWYQSRIAGVGTGDTSNVPSYARGSVDFLNDNSALISALNNPDASTGIHELAHVFRRDMLRDGGLSPEDVASVESHLGVKDGNWTTDHEEEFSRGFERYAADGIAPTPALARVFEQFKQWLLGIYQATKGSAGQFVGTPIEASVSPALQNAFEKLLGKTDETQQISARPVEPKTPVSTYAGSINERLFGGDPAALEEVRATAQRLGMNDRETVTDAQTRELGKSLNLSYDDVRKMRPGVFPAPPEGLRPAVWYKSYVDAIRNLHAKSQAELVDAKNEAREAQEAHEFDPTPENLKAVTRTDLARAQAQQTSDAMFNHANEAANVSGVVFQGHNRPTEAYKGTGYQEALAEAPQLSEALPTDIPAPKGEGPQVPNVPRPVRKGSVTPEQLQAAVDAYKGGQKLFQQNPQTETPEFKNWFGESKVVDADGKPLVVYHGTTEKFNRFDSNKSVDGTHWFSSDRNTITSGESGAAGSKHVLDLYASIKKPAGWDEYEKYSLGQLQDKGYDGVILKNEDGSFDGFVFDPKNLKSASKNRGTFDPNNPNILYQKEETPLSVIGRYHYEQGTRSFPKWRAAVEKTIGEKIPDIPAKDAWYQARDTQKKNVRNKQIEALDPIFKDNLRELGRKGAAKFLRDIPDETRDKILGGAPLSSFTPGEKAVITQHWDANTPESRKTGSKASQNVVKQIVNEVKAPALKAARSARMKALNASKVGTGKPATVADPVTKTLKATLGKNFDAFGSELEIASPGLLERLKGGTATLEELSTAGKLVAKHTPTRTVAAITDAQAKLKAAVKDARKEIKQANAVEPHPFDALVSRRVVGGMKTATDIRTALETTDMGKSAVGKLMAGEDLTPAESRLIARTIDAQKRVVAKSNPDEVTARLTKLMRDARTGRLGFDDPFEAAKNQLISNANRPVEKMGAGADPERLAKAEAARDAKVKAISEDLAKIDPSDTQAIGRVMMKHDTLLDQFKQWVLGNILSGWDTGEKIAVSHPATVSMEEMRRWLYGDRSETLGGIKAGFNAVKTQGIPEAKATLKHGTTAAYLEGKSSYKPLDARIPVESRSPLHRAVLRAHSAFYQLTQTYNTERGLHLFATEDGKAKGLTGQALEDHVQDVLLHPEKFKPLAEKAIRFGMEETQTHANPVATALSDVTRGRPALKATKAVLMPVANLPLNAMKFALDAQTGLLTSRAQARLYAHWNPEASTADIKAYQDKVLHRGVIGAGIAAAAGIGNLLGGVTEPDTKHGRYVGRLNAFGQSVDVPAGPMGVMMDTGADIAHDIKMRNFSGLPQQLLSPYVQENPVIRSADTLTGLASAITGKQRDESTQNRALGGLGTELMPLSGLTGNMASLEDRATGGGTRQKGKGEFPLGALDYPINALPYARTHLLAPSLDKATGKPYPQAVLHSQPSLTPEQFQREEYDNERYNETTARRFLRQRAKAGR